MYLSYDEYRDDFGGGLSEAEFNAAEPDAEALITYFTFVRGDIFADTNARTIKALKQAVAKATDVVSAHASEAESGSAGIKSESNDGYSVSRVVEQKDGETSDDVMRRKVYAEIRIYLLPTGWLSRSMNRGCCC